MKVVSALMKSTILIADRNPYVRRFLQRELIHAGYDVLLAENARQVQLIVDRDPSLKLVIIDPDLPDKETAALFEDLRSNRCSLPVLVHCLPEEYADVCSATGTWFVEKGGNSVEAILAMVQRLCR
jgi:DNA-binding NtrC family response regulator